MKNKQKQTKEEPKNPKQQIQPTAENLSEAELEKAAGGAATAGFLKASSRVTD